MENENLNIVEKIQVRECAHKTFKNTFDFLQLKDPKTFVEVSTLGQEFTKGDEEKIWNDIRKNQQKILAEKKIKHRNFGIYSKHSCPYEDCVWNGVMIRQGSPLSWGSMHFLSDKKDYHQKVKAKMRKLDRKSKKQIVNKDLNNE